MPPTLGASLLAVQLAVLGQLLAATDLTSQMQILEVLGGLGPGLGLGLAFRGEYYGLAAVDLTSDMQMERLGGLEYRIGFGLGLMPGLI